MKNIVKPMRIGIMLLGLFAAGSLGADTGKLYLVSTGCGDPDNMTIRAHKVIESADVVFTMRGNAGSLGDLLKGKEIHAAGHILFGVEGRRPDLPKHTEGHARPDSGDKSGEQAKGGKPPMHGEGPASIADKRDEIRSIIRNTVGKGKTVAILDGGDPTIFGPQVGFMKEFSDLNPSIVPGVSSFNAANAALKCGVVGGPGGGRSIALTSSPRPHGDGMPDASNKADPADAIVFFTMHSDLSATVEELKKHYAADTPIAIVLYAGYADKERVIRGTLDDIVAKAGPDKLPFEHLIYVGSFLGKAE